MGAFFDYSRPIENNRAYLTAGHRRVGGAISQELPEGTVTVLFTDVEGSTGLTTRRGDEAARDVLRAHEELVRQQVQEHDGREVKAIGDGFMVAFGSARKAVACAVGIQRTLEENNRGQPSGDQVRVRMGLNTGEVVREQDDLFGETVNAAARIAAKAKGGQVLISEATKAPLLVERTPFVGREAERAELRRCLDQVAGGRGALVMIGGEPGVGKTRLAEELMAEARQRGMTALIGRCYEME